MCDSRVCNTSYKAYKEIVLFLTLCTLKYVLYVNFTLVRIAQYR